MLYKGNSNSNHCLFSDLPSASTRVRHTLAAAAVESLEFEVSKGVERANKKGFSFWSKFVRWMGVRVQSTVGYFPDFFLWRRCWWGGGSISLTILFFPLVPLLLVFIIIIIISTYNIL